MVKPVRQIFAIVAALALMAAPAASCCLGFAGHGHAATAAATLPSGHASGGSDGDYCGVGKKAPASDHDGTFDKCPGHGGGQCVAPGSTEIPQGLLSHIPASFPVITWSQADFMPALLRISAPPQGPPLIHPTPVALNTMLRL